MSGLDIFAIFVLVVLVVAALVIWVTLAMLPGRIARTRDHPQAEAINIGGWLGALLGGVLWPIFLIWAYTKPIRIVEDTGGSNEVEALRKRVSSLEKALKTAKEAGK